MQAKNAFETNFQLKLMNNSGWTMENLRKGCDVRLVTHRSQEVTEDGVQANVCVKKGIHWGSCSSKKDQGDIGS